MNSNKTAQCLASVHLIKSCLLIVEPNIYKQTTPIKYKSKSKNVYISCQVEWVWRISSLLVTTAKVWRNQHYSEILWKRQYNKWSNKENKNIILIILLLFSLTVNNKKEWERAVLRAVGSIQTDFYRLRIVCSNSKDVIF